MRDDRPAAVLLDLDGVLVDSRAAIAGSINHALATQGLATRPGPELDRWIGPPLAVAFAELTGRPVDSALVAACVRAYRDRYAAASLRETVVVPGIAAALGELRSGRRLAVATSKPLEFAEPLLAALGLRALFDAVAAPAGDALAEDKATTIGAALAALGTGDAVMVGDRSFDVAGAHAHGLPAIGVMWGIGDAAELRAAGAELLVDTPAQLPGAVARCAGGGPA